VGIKLKKNERDLREQIAKEIESKGDEIVWIWTAIGGRTPEAIDWYVKDVKFFANIVRGEYERSKAVID
jgi:hypothetical protein